MLCHEVDECTWDSESRVLITKADTVEQEKGERIEKEAWYKDKYWSHMQDKSKKSRKKYAAPEAL